MHTLLLALALALNAPDARADDRVRDRAIQTEVLGVEDFCLSARGIGFSVRTRLTRDRGLPICIRGIHYEVLLRDTVIGEGGNFEEIRLRRGVAAEVALPTVVSLRNSLRALLQLHGPALELRVVGEAHAGFWWFSRPRPFEVYVTLGDLLHHI